MNHHEHEHEPERHEQETELGTDPEIVGDRDEPDLPVRTSTDEPTSAGQRSDASGTRDT